MAVSTEPLSMCWLDPQWKNSRVMRVKLYASRASAGSDTGDTRFFPI